MSAQYKTSGRVGCAALIGIIPMGLFASWVHLVLWGWFAVPLGLPILTLGQVFGLRMVVNYFIQSLVPIGKKYESEAEELSAIFGIPVIYGLLYLGIGLFVKAVLL